MKILVADDSKTNLALITDSLKRLHHEVIPANSGEEAIRLFQTAHPDLVILDVVMEKMDGFECAKKIRDIEKDDWIPIIFLSASVDDASIAKGIDAGGDDYLTKPFSEITLEAKIKAMQRIAEMRRRLCATTRELEILSSVDTLTGVYNRFQFEKILRSKLHEADRHGITIGLMFIDLDHFKSVNDAIGHHVGDLLLKEFANRIKSCIREEDFLARIGGDEFVVILNHLQSLKNAGEIAEKMLAAITPPFYLEEHVLRMTASIGIASYPYEGTTKDSLIQNADIAMYYAKELGRNNFQFFTSELNKKFRQQISVWAKVHLVQIS